MPGSWRFGHDPEERRAPQTLPFCGAQDARTNPLQLGSRSQLKLVLYPRTFHVVPFHSFIRCPAQQCAGHPMNNKLIPDELASYISKAKLGSRFPGSRSEGDVTTHCQTAWQQLLNWRHGRGERGRYSSPQQKARRERAASQGDHFERSPDNLVKRGVVPTLKVVRLAQRGYAWRGWRQKCDKGSTNRLLLRKNGGFPAQRVGVRALGGEPGVSRGPSPPRRGRALPSGTNIATFVFLKVWVDRRARGIIIWGGNAEEGAMLID